MFFRKRKRVLLIGLDCASPELLFDKYIHKLPNLRYMMENGTVGKLRSSTPPITIPAWMVMHSGKTPGQLGLYGFRHRDPGDYQNYWIVTSDKIKAKRVWDYLGEKGKKSIVVGIPPTYPVFPINGNLVSGFITPDANKEFTYPSDLKKEIQKLVGDYPFDIIFRTEERDKFLDALYDMTDKHFKVIEYLMQNKKWDFFTFIEIGLDRLHHTFWKYFDKRHHLYEPGNKYENVALEYYQHLDKKVGRLLDIVPQNTTVIAVSDHGAKRMKGCFCINEWLMQEGLLKLKNYPEKRKRFEELKVDWENTKVWGWGGYYARIFINKKGREPQGKVEDREYEALRDKLIQKFKNIKGPNKEDWNTIVHKPEEIYDDPQGEYPDLMVYFDDLSYRSAGSIGNHRLFLEENDTGPDGAVHDWNGAFIMYDKAESSNPACGQVGLEVRSRDTMSYELGAMSQYNILDVAPTILDKFNLKLDGYYKGKIIR